MNADRLQAHSPIWWPLWRFNRLIDLHCYLFHFKWNNNAANKHIVRGKKRPHKLEHSNWIDINLWHRFLFNYKYIAKSQLIVARWTLLFASNTWPYKSPNNLRVFASNKKIHTQFTVTVHHKCCTVKVLSLSLFLSRCGQLILRMKSFEKFAM